MRNAIRKKLYSDKGASLILALLFFVMCAIIGSVILTAATVAAGRVKDLQKTTQEEYTLQSAAELLKQTVIDGNLQHVFTERFVDVTPENMVAADVKDLGTTIQSMAQYVYVKNLWPLLTEKINTTPGITNIRITARRNTQADEIGLAAPLISGIDEDSTPIVHVTMEIDPEDNVDKTLKPVTMLLEMYPNFDIKATLSLTQEESGKTGNRQMIVWLYAADMDAAVSYRKKTSSAPVKTAKVGQCSLNWLNAVIQPL